MNKIQKFVISIGMALAIISTFNCSGSGGGSNDDSLSSSNNVLASSSSEVIVQQSSSSVGGVVGSSSSEESVVEGSSSGEAEAGTSSSSVEGLSSSSVGGVVGSSSSESVVEGSSSSEVEAGTSSSSVEGLSSSIGGSSSSLAGISSSSNLQSSSSVVSSSSSSILSSSSVVSSSSSVELIQCGTGNNYHNPETQFCDGNIPVNKCDGKVFNTTTHGCCNNTLFDFSNQRCQSNVVQTKCGTGSNYANPTQFCDGNNAVNKCGGEAYNTATQGCCNNALFDLSNQRCQSNVIQTKCGTGSNYANPTQFCDGNNVVNKCNGDVFDPATQRCQNNVIETICGENGTYHNPQTQFCYLSFALEKCSGMEYDVAANQRCQNGEIVTLSYGTLIDTRDDKSYRTIVIGTQTWMAQNLQYNAEGSKCFNDSDTYCDYGRMYDWATAMGIASAYNTSNYSPSSTIQYQGICPDGWHIPNRNEWITLMAFVGGTGTNNTKGVARYLNGIYSFNNVTNAQDNYGFTGVFYVGNKWSASEVNASAAYSLGMEQPIIGTTITYNYYDVVWNNSNKNSNNINGLSFVRCVMD